MLLSLIKINTEQSNLSVRWLISIFSLYHPGEQHSKYGKKKKTQKKTKQAVFFFPVFSHFLNGFKLFAIALFLAIKHHIYHSILCIHDQYYIHDNISLFLWRHRLRQQCPYIIWKKQYVTLGRAGAGGFFSHVTYGIDTSLSTDGGEATSETRGSP